MCSCRTGTLVREKEREKNRQLFHNIIAVLLTFHRRTFYKYSLVHRHSLARNEINTFPCKSMTNHNRKPCRIPFGSSGRAKFKKFLTRVGRLGSMHFVFQIRHSPRKKTHLTILSYVKELQNRSILLFICLIIVIVIYFAR